MAQASGGLEPHDGGGEGALKKEARVLPCSSLQSSAVYS